MTTGSTSTTAGGAAPAGAWPRTVRDAAFDVLRERRLTTMFANPGSTEVPFLAGLPGDLRFMLALHEASVVGMATGWAIGTREPALVLLHTTAGLGNGVAAGWPWRSAARPCGSRTTTSSSASSTTSSRAWPTATSRSSSRSPSRPTGRSRPSATR
jgi:hypothetical protein